MLLVEGHRVDSVQGARDSVPADAPRINLVLVQEILYHGHGSRNHIFLVIVEGHALLQQSSNPA